MDGYTVTLTNLIYGGRSIARLPDGRAVFVPFALPGETVRIRLTGEEAGYAEGEIVEIVAPAPDRTEPRCRHFGQCGGCHYQHMRYPAQLAAKQMILRDQLVRLGGIANPPVAATVATGEPWRYRNQMQFHRAADGRLGLQAARSNTVIPLAECHLPTPALDEAWRQLNPQPGSGKPRKAKQQKQDRRQRTKYNERMALRVGENEALQTEDSAPIQLSVLGQRFQVSAGAFFQVNLATAEQMVRHVLEVWPATPVRCALDLYCGVGLFSRFVAPQVQRLIGVESAPPACRDFAVNLSEFAHVSLAAGRVETVLARIAEPVDYVIADPPRAGLGGAVVDQLLRLAPPHLVYVSCDPATLARDARQLVAGGYQLDGVTPFDLFPQTYHIESISCFSRTPLSSNSQTHPPPPYRRQCTSSPAHSDPGAV